MCGIAGYVLNGRPERGPGRVLTMLRSIRHRAPDDEGLALFTPEAGGAYAFATHESAARVAGRPSSGRVRCRGLAALHHDGASPVLDHRLLDGGASAVLVCGSASLRGIQR